MKKKITKKGRKKLFSKTPSNLAFWKFTIRKPKELEQFLLRGDERQKHYIIRVLNYLKQFEPIEFKTIQGQMWLKKFKETL